MQKAVNSSAPPAAYVLDSYALLAYFESEVVSEQIVRLLEGAKEGKCRLYLCVVNLGEVVYIVERERGLPEAQETLARIDELSVEIVNADRNLALAAAHLKKAYPIAYADCFAAALAQIKEAVLITGDPEFAKIKPESNVRIEWLAVRP
jgi:predicted nucleic acid-binding protein